MGKWGHAWGPKKPKPHACAARPYPYKQTATTPLAHPPRLLPSPSPAHTQSMKIRPPHPTHVQPTHNTATQPTYSLQTTSAQKCPTLKLTPPSKKRCLPPWPAQQMNAEKKRCLPDEFLFSDDPAITICTPRVDFFFMEVECSRAA
eukprot:scaffold6553_cov126-Isochrysis_galbana.AAC.1